MLLLVGMLLSLPACKDAEYEALGNQVYLANSSKNPSERVVVGENGLKVLLQVRCDQKVHARTAVSLKVDEEALKAYNKRHSTSYELLPAEFYAFDTQTASIEVNEANALPLSISLKELSKDLNKTGKTYALPVSISQVDNPDLAILSSSASYIYVVVPTPYGDVPVLKRGNGMKMALNGESLTVNDFTVEFLVKIDNLGLGKNNQILFNAADHPVSLGGTDSEIFTRFAADGAAGKFDKFQIKNQGKSYDAKFSFKNNVWYHIACVNDNAAGTMTIYVNGVFDSSFPNAQIPTTVNSSSERGFRFCGESDNDGYMRSNVQAAQIRFWSVARTEAQINNNMYGIDPKTPGLAAYWPLNEGEGNVLSDATGNGHNALIFGNQAVWNLNQLLEVGK